MSEIKFSCQHCGQTIACDASAAGNAFSCPACGKGIQVPGTAAKAEAAPDVEACDVFISYRRQGGEHLARLMMKELVRRGYSVFMDTENLRQGKFDRAILRNIELAKDVVVICSLGALDRCVNEDDWVRQEISCALKLNKNVVRLMDRNFRMPPKESLPADIAGLADTKSVLQVPGLPGATIQKLGEEFLVSEPDPEKVQVDEASDEGQELAWDQIRAMIAGGVSGMMLLMALVTIRAVFHMDPRLHHLQAIDWGIVGVAVVCSTIILIGSRLSYTGERAGAWMILVGSVVMFLAQAVLSYYFLKFVGHLHPFLKDSMTGNYIRCAVNTIPFLVLAFLYRKGK